MYHVEVRFDDGDRRLIGTFLVEAQPNNVAQRSNAGVIEVAKDTARRNLKDADRYRPLAAKIL